jgi:hypothetical protein
MPNLSNDHPHGRMSDKKRLALINEHLATAEWFQVNRSDLVHAMFQPDQIELKSDCRASG